MPQDAILVAVDPSGCAVEVVEQAAVFARDLGARVDLVTCVDLPSGVSADTVITDGPMQGRTALGALEKDAFTALSGLRLAFDRHGVPVDLSVKVGDPVDNVLATCDGHRLVVLGTHGRTGVKRMLFGSIAERILRRAAVPVMVIHAEDAGVHHSPTHDLVEALADG